MKTSKIIYNSKKIAQIIERQKIRQMTFSEKIVYLQAKRGVSVQPTAQPITVVVAKPELPSKDTCPAGGAHDYKAIKVVGCYCQSRCTKCGDLWEADSSD